MQFLEQVIRSKKGEDQLLLGSTVSLQNYDESIYPRIGSLRSTWKREYAINLEKSTYSILFKVLCGYLDQGIAITTFPVLGTSFLESIKELDKNSSDWNSQNQTR